MTPSPILIPRHKLSDPRKQEKVDPLKSLCGISTPFVFLAATTLLVALYEWPRKWLMSGTPILMFCLLQGAANGYRVLPAVPLWTILPTINLTYAVSATSWLLLPMFAAWCYSAIFFACLFQFEAVADFARRSLRSLLKQLQFVNDKIAFFNIPALEIDRDVAGLMVVRGVTFSLSKLTIVAHGVEVGIKLSDDMEVAIQTEKVTIALFRRIEIEDVYANLKGGKYEMTFAELEESTENADGDPLMNTETPLLRAATMNSDTSEPIKVKMTEEMTDGAAMRDISAEAALDSVTQLSPDNDKASKQYNETLRHIQESSTIHECQEHIKHSVMESDPDSMIFDPENPKDLRAAICSQLHDKASVPHPPSRSVKVTTLQNLSPPYVRRFMHRLPKLLRLLLFLLSYFHPMSITSITAAGSGRWIKEILVEKVFEEYSENDSEIRRLERKISSWLANANFVLELESITGLAQVPFMRKFDINCYLEFGDLMAYRTLPKDLTLKQVVRLGGADATFVIPSFLLPHHEHLLPPVPTAQDKAELEGKIDDADGIPKTLQAEVKLEQAEKDEANVKMAVHGSLPAVFDQELLNFIAALVKATKVVEMEKEHDGDEIEVTGIKSFSKNLQRVTKDGMKKAVVGGIVNDKWIAKMVGKICAKLEKAQGDIGYSGNIPVALGLYRPAKGETLPSKILS